MKNYMKKIIVGFFALAVLFTAHSASATWNTDPDDCQVPLAVGNYTTNVGIRNGPDGCWTLTSVSGSASNTMNVRAYYDNTSGSPKTNVRVILSPLSSGSSSTFTFSGTIESDQGNLNLGTVTINLSSSQTLTYGSTVWKKNNGSTTTFTGNQIINGGQTLGTIPSTVPSSPNLDGQGSLVVSFHVGNNNNGGTCNDTSATNYGGSLPCRYNNNNNCTISNFRIDGSSSTTIDSGDHANLEWNTEDCTSVDVSGPNFTSSSLDGDRDIYPRRSGTYTLRAYGNNGGTQTRTVRVYVDEDEDENNCRINSFTVNGSNQTTIQSGAAANLYWNTTDCTSVSVSGPGINSNARSGNQTVYPTTNSNYTINAYGNNSGTQTRSVYVNVNTVIVNNTCAVTTVATNVGQNSATLNGLVSGSTGASYFEYGTDVNLGSRTVARNASGAFTEFVGGLASNTNYYFRFVSQCSGGISYGSIEFFRTGGIVRNTTTIIQGATVIGTQSPIMLKIENRFQYVGVGDVVDYMVTYKNIGKTTLTRPVLQVIVPKGFTLINTSRGTFSQETNTLTVPLEDLLPGAEGVVYLQALVNSLELGNAQIVSTAILVYTSPSGAQENAIAYVLNSPRNGNVLGASAFWSGLWGIGLIGWLLIFILILLIILATRSYRRKSTIHSTNPVTGGHTTTTTNY
jgi:hypothetical protein